MISVVEIKNLFFAYKHQSILEDVSFDIHERDFATIVGPNGGGKTTLLKLMLGLLKPSSGSIRVFGRKPEDARREIGYVPQHVFFDPHFPVNVMDVVLMGRLGRFGKYTAKDKDVALSSLVEVGMADIHRHSFSDLSGGQQQRVLIARALVSSPRLLLLDEPTANLDQLVEIKFFELLQKLNQQHTIMLVSHDVAFVSQYANRVICVHRKVAVHPAHQLTGEIMNEMYGTDVRMVRHDLNERDEGRGG